ncbi:hypothetical protein BJ741DRAFT_376393 [Chytriomyces cf. hyalinus JEL632]|nr:hypothetical protein BJ741DRAFT_376393 [Chytriomyces cf. hyalinus JEL632]
MKFEDPFASILNLANHAALQASTCARRVVTLRVVVLVLVLSTTLLNLSSYRVSSVSSTKARSICDPYKEADTYVHPGSAVMRFLNEGRNNHGSCRVEDSVEVLKSVVNKSAVLPDFMANKMVLFIGDSFERNAVKHLCELTGAQIMSAKLNGSMTQRPNEGDARICVIRDPKNNSIFVAINIFHFGVLNDFKDMPQLNGMHWSGDSPLNVTSRIAWIPSFLRNVAAVAYPELCSLNGQVCPTPHFFNHDDKETPATLENSTPKLLSDNPFWYPVPDLLVAQSSMWDMERTRWNYKGSIDEMAQFAQDWREAFERKVLEPIDEIFGRASHARFDEKESVFFLRTQPLPVKGASQTSAQFSMVNTMNQMLRKGPRKVGSTEWGVLDWEELLRGMNDCLYDKVHPNAFGSRVLWQLILSRLRLSHKSTSSD